MLDCPYSSRIVVLVFAHYSRPGGLVQARASVIITRNGISFAGAVRIPRGGRDDRQSPQRDDYIELPREIFSQDVELYHLCPF